MQLATQRNGRARWCFLDGSMHCLASSSDTLRFVGLGQERGNRSKPASRNPKLISRRLAFGATDRRMLPLLALSIPNVTHSVLFYVQGYPPIQGHMDRRTISCRMRAWREKESDNTNTSHNHLRNHDCR